MTIVTDEMESVETVSLGVWVNVGSRHESESLNGVSHMLEHMAFKGTYRRSARQIAEEIESVGGVINAYTSSEVTAYHATVMKEDIGIALEIIGDILLNSSFDPEELEREREVIIQEIAQNRDSPEECVFEIFQELAYPGQPLGRPIMGTAEIVASIGRESLVNYMGQHYGASRMVVAAAGKVDHAVFAGLVDTAFAGLSLGVNCWPEEARYQGGTLHQVRNSEQAHLVVGYLGPGSRDPLRYDASVVSMILGGGMSSRLFQEIRENLGLAYSIYGFTSCYEDTGIVGFYAGTSPNNTEQLIAKLIGEIERILEGVGKPELERAKAQMRAGVLLSLESTTSRAERLARDILLYGEVIPVDSVIKRIDDVSEAGVLEAVGRMLKSNPTLAMVGPRT
ncbi:MAG: pitrilysin family protein [Rhodospirillaceae bacterium]